MAPNKKKNDSKPTNENVSCEEKWPNLPQQLINFIGRKPHLKLIRNVGSAGVNKSWKTEKNKCCPNPKSPILELQHTSNDQRGSRILGISFHQGWWWYLPERRRPVERICGHIIGCSHGLILTPDSFSDITKRYVNYWWLPSWDSEDVPIQRAALSSSLTDPKGCSVLAITGRSSPAFGVSRVECHEHKRFLSYSSKEWSKQDTTLVDPNDPDKGLMKFTNVVGCNGRFYALTLQGTLAVIEDVDSQFRVTKLCRRRAVPSSPSRRFTEYLIESEGEILLVFLVFGRSEMSVDDVEVFRLRQAGDELSWVEMKSLGDRTIFVGIDSCACVTASQVGCKSNAIYFAHHRSVDSWRLYDMETRSILPCYDSCGSELKSPVWEEAVDEDSVSCQVKVKFKRIV